VESKALQARVEALEREVAELRKLLRPKDPQDELRELLDGMINPGVAEIFDEALKYREKDRRRARKK
jgi:hypothetical protein